VRALVERIRAEQGRLDILVNDIWGGEKLFKRDKPVWEHDLENGLRLLRLGIDTHLITAHYALPLMIERRAGAGLRLYRPGRLAPGCLALHGRSAGGRPADATGYR